MKSSKRGARITNSSVNPGNSRSASLDNWVGPMQHYGIGISTDPDKPKHEKGVLYSKQHRDDD